MSATRKLQTEIAQVLKKVEEGVALFDDIWSKVYSAGQQSLKEKYEGDLKKEIKKLQRLRDQIKTWLGSSEIKDKGPLTEARKVIESKMEQFKVCEKDTKTKAYSKEGLARDSRSDPKEAAKEEKRDWLNDCLDRLADLIDSVEADLEKITNKKKSKEQVDKLENRIKKNRWHIARLEQVLKLMENDDLDPTRIDSIKDDVDYYIESAADDDGSTGVDDEFDIYEDLALDSFVSAAERSAESEFGGADALSPLGPDPAVAAADAPPAASKPVEAASDDGKIVKKAPVASVSSSTAGIAAIGKPQAQPAVKVPPVVPPAKAVAKAAPTPVPTIGAKAPVVGGAAVTAQLASHAGATAGKGASATASSSAASSAAGSGAKKTPQSKSGHDEGEGDKDDTAAAPSWATAIAQNSKEATAASNTAASMLFRAEAARNSANTAASSVSSSDGGSLSVVSSSSSSLQAGNVAVAAANVAPSTFPNQPGSQNSSFFGASNPIGSGTSSSSGQASSSTTNLPIGGVSQLTRNQVALSNEVLVAAHMLKQSFLNSPESAETDRQSGYVPRNPYSTHASYPTKPPTSSENTALFERLPPDTLFFAFYYQQGGYQQYLAAKQLKKHSWRFHKKYMTWFQRHEEPKIATDDYEEGGYVYFDNENDWCQLIKQDFKFEFKFLEDEL